jgi:metal-responsive CopG/Arc/MetJ family transcriptional regulator
MPRKSWININFPEDLLQTVEKLIENPYVKANYGYTSIPEFLRDGARDLIEKIKKEIEAQTGIRP